MILTEQIQQRKTSQLSQLCHHAKNLYNTANYLARQRLGRHNNQQFVQIPFSRLIQMLKYKAALVGIRVELAEESHTSKCSFLDNEVIGPHAQYQGRRVTRVLSQAADGRRIHADVNGAYNILRKVVPEAEIADGVAALGLVPQSMLIT